jgi:hypothetical protein
MNMPTAVINLTANYVAEAMQRHRSQSLGNKLAFWLKILLVPVLALVAIWGFLDGRTMVGFMALTVIACLFAQRRFDGQARKALRSSPYRDEVLTIELTEDDFHTCSSLEETKTQWSVFTKVVHFKDGFLLFRGPKLVNWIPFSSVVCDSSQISVLESLLRSKIQNHKIA